MHSTLKKTLKWSVIVLASVVIGIPLLLAAIIAVDQNLKPEATAFADFSDDLFPILSDRMRPSEKQTFHAFVREC